MITKIRNLLLFLRACVKLNGAQLFEYKLNSLLFMISMMINDAVMVLVWVFFFERFPVVKGWQLEDMILLNAALTIVYGIVVGGLGNITSLASMIVNGQLDYYMSLPKPVLLHVLVSRIDVFNLGDILFGLTLLFFTHLSAIQLAMFLIALLLASVIFMSILVMAGSLSFFVGNSDSIQSLVLSGVVTFSSYPMSIHNMGIKVILLTIFPAGWIGFIPVEIARLSSWSYLGYMLAVACLMFLLMIWLFNKGLKHYESGNMLTMRG